ncbi:VOC family protein [Kribbella speibonae]|uniref:VOC family protein n=1 Tax=Kribbella speibonae TaxID=1572660 RepID=A0ABY2A1F6_9ACTN|nr:VOC family protein [Kribbella speibonae]TCC21865.1 VOC family protein [Kribbella speibonae]
MRGFAGIDHLGLSVTDLDRSEHFYTVVLGLKPLMDFGTVRTFIDRETGFVLALSKHELGTDAPFTELPTGLDHIGLTAASRDELVEWERRFDALGVPYTPIRDEAFASHLNFRDPDNIALELSASNAVYDGWMAELRERDIPADEIRARVMDYLEGLK